MKNRYVRIRELHGISQTQLAALLGIHQNSLSRYEDGSVDFPLYVIRAYSRHFSVSIEWLVGASNVPLPPSFGMPDKKIDFSGFSMPQSDFLEMEFLLDKYFPDIL